MKQKNSVTLSQVNQARIKALIDKVGSSQAASFLGCSKHAMERAAGGLPVHRGTSTLLTVAIAERDAAGKSP
jgi:hypothetical protein